MKEVLAAAQESEARLNGKMPEIVQLLVDQQKWIRENLSQGHVPGALTGCHCGMCANAELGYSLLRRYEKLKLTDHGSTLTS